MATTISFINMKGGVGKSTLAFNLAAYCANDLGKKVLAVDLDPQANLSQYFMGEHGYAKFLNDQRPTIADIVEGYTPPSRASGSPQALTADDVLYPITKWWARDRLDLVPSQFELARALREPQGKEGFLARFLADLSKSYDVVLIDCAPTESLLTSAAYRTSRYLVVPVRPEFLATVGFPLLFRSLEEFRIKNPKQSLEVAGIVFNDKRRVNTPPEQLRSIRDVTAAAKKVGWPVFDHPVHHSDSFPTGAREGSALPYTTGSHTQVIREFRRVAAEFAKATGLT